MSTNTAFIFDLDGTVADTCDFIVKAKLHVLESLGIPIPDIEHLRSLNGMKLEDTFALATGIDDLAIQREAIMMYHPTFLRMSVEEGRLFPGALEVLTDLRLRGIKIGITSMRMGDDLDRIMRHFHLDQVADAWISEDRAGAPKPSPAMIDCLMKRLGASPETTYVVGDTIYDLEMAENAGAHKLGVSFGAQSARMLSLREPEIIADNFAQIEAFAGNLPL